MSKQDNVAYCSGDDVCYGVVDRDDQDVGFNNLEKIMKRLIEGPVVLKNDYKWKDKFVKGMYTLANKYDLIIHFERGVDVRSLSIEKLFEKREQLFYAIKCVKMLRDTNMFYDVDAQLEHYLQRREVVSSDAGSVVSDDDIDSEGSVTSDDDMPSLVGDIDVSSASTLVTTVADAKCESTKIGVTVPEVKKSVSVIGEVQGSNSNDNFGHLLRDLQKLWSDAQCKVGLTGGKNLSNGVSLYDCPILVRCSPHVQLGPYRAKYGDVIMDLNTIGSAHVGTDTYRTVYRDLETAKQRLGLGWINESRFKEIQYQIMCRNLNKYKGRVVLVYDTVLSVYPVLDEFLIFDVTGRYDNNANMFLDTLCAKLIGKRGERVKNAVSLNF